MSDLLGWTIDSLVRQALEEDIVSGDLTTEAIVPEELITKAVVLSKETGVLAGLPVLERVFFCLDPSTIVEKLLEDGAKLLPGSEVAVIKGKARSILTGERVALNFLQHLSGIATQTRQLSEMIKGTKARLVDTRKTTPGLRILEKYAVRVGGGYNHRMGLYDGILIKDNHIRLAGGITPAVVKARAGSPHLTKIEVEVEDLKQLEEAINAGADLILLDNMDQELLRKAVELTGGRVPLEASGGIRAATIKTVAATGIDYLSVGALTHSAPALDLSMDISELS